jgi:hypothetical protein
VPCFNVNIDCGQIWSLFTALFCCCWIGIYQINLEMIISTVVKSDLIVLNIYNINLEMIISTVVKSSPPCARCLNMYRCLVLQSI